MAPITIEISPDTSPIRNVVRVAKIIWLKMSRPIAVVPSGNSIDGGLSMASLPFESRSDSQRSWGAIQGASRATTPKNKMIAAPNLPKRLLVIIPYWVTKKSFMLSSFIPLAPLLVLSATHRYPRVEITIGNIRYQV